MSTLPSHDPSPRSDSLDVPINFHSRSPPKSERFGSQDLVLVPSYDYGLSRCLRSRPPECLWEAPCNFSTMQPLKALYGAVGMRVEKHDIRQFFQETLRIPDIAHDNITKELESMKRKQQHDIETVGKLYQRLQKMYTADTSIAESLR